MGRKEPDGLRAIALALAAAITAGGCALRNIPVRGYVPNPPLDPAPGLRLKVAVLPFIDDAEPFVFKGSKFPRLDGTFNLMRGDPGYFVPTLDPKSVAGFLRDDLEASGAFVSVALARSRSEAEQADVIIRGVIERAEYFSQAGPRRSVDRLTLALRLRASSRDGKVLWEKPYYSVDDVGGPDRLISQAVISSLRDFFAAARRDLLSALDAKRQ
jgi:hypothetical protein